VLIVGEGLMLKIHPLERPNIVDILERLQEISLSRNVSPKQPLSSLVTPASSLATGSSDAAQPGMSHQDFVIVFFIIRQICSLCFAFEVMGYYALTTDRLHEHCSEAV